MIAPMPTYDASTAECLVFTFKEGLLSKIAHDLKIKVTNFQLEVDVDAGRVSAEFDAKSLQVVNAMKNGAEAPSSLSSGDKSKIGGQIIDDVLHANQHPTIRFASGSVAARADGGYDLSGDLTLHGITRPISIQTQRAGDRQVAELTLHQPDYGITPYKAMMGTLKVQADVKITLSVPA